MAKPTGFLEFEREIPTDESPLARVNNWDEFHHHLPEEKLLNQAARCMDCGIPFCHSGIMLEGMTSGCPLNNLIPEWNDLIYRGLWKMAIERLLKTNNFPEFTGRVCPAPCEGSCTLGLNNPAVTIKNIEVSIVERAFAEGWIKPNLPQLRTGKKVAVVGSGPAGLAAADQLNQAGHTVTVFERADRIGGLLMYGIPNMKLDKQAVVQRRVDIMAAEGITFRTSTEVGKDYPSELLLKEFDAVVLCGGATKPRDLKIEGRDLNGIYFAVDFLSQNTKCLLDDGGEQVRADGKDVIIIGGGDTGTDCVATSLRHGCKSQIQFEIMPMPSLERTSDNPWPQWPRTLKVDYGQEESIAEYGRDPREYCITTKKFIGDENGNVKELHTMRVEWMKDDNGRLYPREIRGSEQVWPAQLVLIAMGFLGPEDKVLIDLGVTRDQRSNAQANYGEYSTNVPGVFAAGDMRRGQSLVVWAIREGRDAAREVDKYLMGSSEL
ncbi:MAG: glutamate synthase subunit beta [bacterium]